jgi:hypothetical protein
MVTKLAANNQTLPTDTRTTCGADPAIAVTTGRTNSEASLVLVANPLHGACLSDCSRASNGTVRLFTPESVTTESVSTIRDASDQQQADPRTEGRNLRQVHQSPEHSRQDRGDGAGPTSAGRSLFDIEPPCTRFEAAEGCGSSAVDQLLADRQGLRSCTRCFWNRHRSFSEGRGLALSGSTRWPARSAAAFRLFSSGTNSHMIRRTSK